MEKIELLQSVSKLLGPKGNCIIITPDVSSLFARLLGFRWWHYRIAHISYFNPKNLKLILHRADMRITHSGRPSWFFSYNYLRKRLQKYIPIWLIPPQVGPLRKMIFPLNLRDSIMLICERIESHE